MGDLNLADLPNDVKTGFYRIRDGKKKVIFINAGGSALIGAGVALGIHSVAHGYDPKMLVISVVMTGLGMYLIHRVNDGIDEQVHHLGKLVFDKIGGL